VRGEKLNIALPGADLPGSSPRAWGKVRAQMDRLVKKRIIPTCVGKSIGHGSEIRFCKDHPHVRGEKRYLFEIPSP